MRICICMYIWRSMALTDFALYEVKICLLPFGKILALTIVLFRMSIICSCYVCQEHSETGGRTQTQVPQAEQVKFNNFLVTEKLTGQRQAGVKPWKSVQISQTNPTAIKAKKILNQRQSPENSDAKSKRHKKHRQTGRDQGTPRNTTN